jgi:hypothetical protein
VFRQISNQGKTTDVQAASIDSLLGTDDWRTGLIKMHEESFIDLLGDKHSHQKIAKASVAEIIEYVIKRLNGIFAGGALDTWLPLGQGRHHWYSLIFAIANASPNASKLAKKLARAVLKAT